MPETNTYNHLDMQRYLQRKMSPQEMHDFEKALMDDPFLADALEGFSASDTALANEHLAAIEEHVTGNRQSTKVVPLTRQNNIWWKVAAVILVVVSGGVLTYSLLTKNTVKTIAQQSLPNDAAMSAPVNDSIAAGRSMAQTEAQVYKTEPDLSNEAKLKTKNKSVNTNTQMKATADSLPIALANSEAASPALAGRNAGVAVTTNKLDSVNYIPSDANAKKLAAASMRAQYEFKGKVSDDNGQPVAGAIVKINSTNAAATTDLKGNFILKATDTVEQVTAAALGASTAVAYLNSNKINNNIVLKLESQNLSEVVVGYGSKRKRTVTMHDSSIGGEPVGGWKNFEQYLNRKIDSLKAGEENDYSNEDVVLEFSIDNYGRPTDIRPSDEAGKRMTGKAVEILSNGPRWKRNKKDKKVKVVIPF